MGMWSGEDPIRARLAPQVIEGRLEEPESWAFRIGLIGDLTRWYRDGDAFGAAPFERLVIVLAYEEARRKSWAVLDTLANVVRELERRRAVQTGVTL